MHGTLELINTEEWFYNETLLKAVYPLAPPEVKRVMCVDGRMDYASLINALERHLNSLSRARTCYEDVFDYKECSDSFEKFNKTKNFI